METFLGSRDQTTLETPYTARTANDGRALAKQVALLCPNPDTAYIGLVELLLNAIKSLLHAQDRWHEEVARRLALPENIEKRAILQTWQTEEARHFLIIDHGNGFDWRPTGPHTATAEALPSPGR